MEERFIALLVYDRQSPQTGLPRNEDTELACSVYVKVATAASAAAAV